MATELDPEAGASSDLEETSLRDDLDAAFEQVATDETAAPAAPGPAAQTATAPVQSGRQRDEQGRFAPTAAQRAAAASIGGNSNVPGSPGQAPGQAGQMGNLQAQPELKAPVSWRPEIREKWGNVDPEVRAEVHRREGELQRVLQSGAQTRQFVETFEKLMQPYEMFIRAENSNPLQAVDNMMRTAAQLRVGTPHAKVEIVAGIIKNFGIDLPALDAMLAGQMNPRAQQHAMQQQPQQLRDPRVDQMIAQQNTVARQQAQFEDQAIRTGLGQFAQGHEFYGDVANVMADIVEVQSRQGMPIDLEKIYQRACQMHDGVNTILQQRSTAQSMGSNNRAALRARRAAVSVKGESTPAGATVPKNDSVRAAIEAAIDSGGHA